MKILELQPRLQAIADMVPAGAVVADIGSDHGYLPVYLLQSGRIPSAIAGDINALPLQHGRQTAEEYGVAQQMEFRLCNGLADFAAGEADCIVIAGMGGENIVSIMGNAPWLKGAAAPRLLLQPMSKPELLRRWLCENGYRILREKLVWDKGTLYAILEVTAGEARQLSPLQCYTGLLEDDPLWPDYLRFWIDKFSRTAAGLRQAVSEESAQKAREWEALIEELKKLEGDALCRR